MLLISKKWMCQNNFAENNFGRSLENHSYTAIFLSVSSEHDSRYMAEPKQTKPILWFGNDRPYVDENLSEYKHRYKNDEEYNPLSLYNLSHQN
jgi:hypothetical protein